MKKTTNTTKAMKTTTLILAICMATAMSACGKSKPTEIPAEDYAAADVTVEAESAVVDKTELEKKIEADLKKEAEEKAKREAESKKAAEEKTKQEAEAKKKAEAEKKAAEAKQKAEAEAKAKKEAEAKKKAEAEKKAAEEKARKEAEAKKKAAEEKAKKEAEEKAKKEAEEKAKKEAEEKAKKEAEEKAKKEAEEKAKKEAEEKAKKEAEEKAKKEAEIKKYGTEVSYQELRNLTDMNPELPKGSKNVRYFVKDKNKTAVVKFDYSGRTWCFRMKDTVEPAGDMTGLKYDDDKEAVTVDVGEFEATAHVTGTCAGMWWFDKTDCISYSLACEEDASLEEITEMADKLYAPVIADVDVDETEEAPEIEETEKAKEETAVEKAQ